MMCQYNIYMDSQTFSLQILSKVEEPTLLHIFEQFRPVRIGIRDFSIYVQISDALTCGSFVEKVKSGAFPQLKSEIFEVLDSSANEAACFQNCPTILESLDQIQSYFLEKKTDETIEPAEKMSVGTEVTHSILERSESNHEVVLSEEQKTQLLTPVYQTSGKIEVEFEEEQGEPQVTVEISSEFFIDKKQEFVKKEAEPLSPDFEVMEEQKMSKNIEIIKPIAEEGSKIQISKEEKKMAQTVCKNMRLNFYVVLVLMLWILWLIV